MFGYACRYVNASCFTTKVDTTENQRSTPCLFGNAVSILYALPLSRNPTSCKENKSHEAWINLNFDTAARDLIANGLYQFTCGLLNYKMTWMLRLVNLPYYHCDQDHPCNDFESIAARIHVASRIIQQCLPLLRQQGPGEGPGLCWPHERSTEIGLTVVVCQGNCNYTCKGALVCSALLLKKSIFDNVPVSCFVLLRSMPGFGYGTWHGTRFFSVPGVCCEVHSRQSGPAQGNGDS